jgi:hypothetical protein
MAENRNKTINRGDDRRQQTGYRVLFDRQREGAAWALSKLLKRLSTTRVRQLHLLAEEMLYEDSIAALHADIATMTRDEPKARA